MKLKNSYNIIFASITLFSCFAFSSFSQDIKATATLDSESIKVGQQVKLKLSITYKVDNGKQIKIKFPEIADTIRKEIEVVGQSKIDTIIPDKNNPFAFVQTKTLYITSFDSGWWAMPPFKFHVNDDSNGVYTEPLLLHVGTVAVDTTLAIKDIKPPFVVSYTFLDWLKDYWWLICSVLAVIILVIVIIYYYRKYANKKPVFIEKEKPKIPAHIIAFGKLEELKNQKLWQEGKLKQYHSALSDIIREYIENRFKIQAIEQTTEEILFGFRNISIDEESKTKLKQLMILSDLVKFAKEQPLPSENELSMEYSYAFVNGTMREESPININQ